MKKYPYSMDKNQHFRLENIKYGKYQNLNNFNPLLLLIFEFIGNFSIY